MNWSEVASVFGTSWNRVYRSVRHAVMWWGLVHQASPQFTAIGVDEIAYKRGHKYLTLVYQIDSECGGFCGSARTGRKKPSTVV